MSNEREEFEKWRLRAGYSTSGHEAADRAWQAWQARSAQPSGEVASPQVGMPPSILGESPNRAPWPDPTSGMLEQPDFNAIWNVIKSWDINVPEQYVGYCGATGNHVRAILDALASQTTLDHSEQVKRLVERTPLLMMKVEILKLKANDYAWQCEIPKPVRAEIESVLTEINAALAPFTNQSGEK